MRETYPDVLATDIVPGEHFDMGVDAQNMRLDQGVCWQFMGRVAFIIFQTHPPFFAN